MIAIVDIRHSARYGSCCWDAAEDWSDKVCYALAYQLVVRVVAVAYDTVCHSRRQQ